MPRFDVELDWFNGDDSSSTDIEAADLESAARAVWDEWRPTGWSSASVHEKGRYISLDLEAATYEAGRWDSAAPSIQ
jgi:hypothetical protein